MKRHRSHRRRSLVAALCSLACATTVTALGAPAASADDALPVYRDTHYSFEERAADLVSRMTLDEKAAQLRTNSAPAIPRLGVQQYTYWSEGQHGVNTLGANTNHGSAGGMPATSFPTNFASSMSWDPTLIYQETTAISDEARGFLDKSLWGVAPNNIGPDKNEYGSLTYWAPTVNLDRDPRWGRNDEAFGEDPYFVGRMAGAFVNGYQGQTQDGKAQTPYLKVAATAKHYALNDVENGRTGISSDTDDRTLREYYTAQFRDLIENAHVSGLMTSYNAINGTPSVADTYTTNQLAQRTYGFGGYITSDCGAVGTTWQLPLSGHDWAPPGWTTDHKSTPTWTNTTTGAKLSGPAGGQAYSLRAGTDVNCTGSEATSQNLREAIQAGVLSEGVVDTALVHLFTIRMETGEFDPPDKNAYTKITKDVIQSPEHQALAEKVADNALVLLKNDGNLLPADGSKLKKVVILGDLANKVTLGGYSGGPSKQVSAVKGITDAVKAADPSASVVFDAAGTSTTAKNDAQLSDATKADIKDADLVVVFVGTDATTAGEGHDRSSLAMPGNYQSLIDQTAALGNRKLALVIQSDGPVNIENAKDKVSSIVFSGYNGESQGTALADVLLGRQNPSGHLNFTWYKDDSQLPAMSDYDITPGGTGGLGRTYRYFTGTPTYPFGYGQSYTTFAYSRVRANTASATADGKVTVRFDVTNTGKVAGATVAQLYATTPFAVPGVEMPKKRLVGFKKTAVLRPGETERVSLTVNVADLAVWDAQAMRSYVPDGTYRFEVGPDSADIVAAPSVEITGRITPEVRYVTVQPEAVQYKVGDTIDLTGKNRWIKDDTDHSKEQRNLDVTADNVVEAVNNDQSFVDLAHAKVHYGSSDPHVATVDDTGHVKVVGSGVATINVKVGGVTGSAVITARYPFTATAPSITEPGGTLTATTTYTNSGSSTVDDVKMSLTVPDGWTAQPTSPASFDQVAGGQTVHTTWAVKVPADAKRTAYTLQAGVAYTEHGRKGGDEAATSVGIPFASVPGAYDNVAITDDADTTKGNLDGGGASLSAQALAAAGITPGGAVTHGGLTFTWPDVPAGTPDNVVAGGQTIKYSGKGTKLGFLGLGDYGTASGSGLITYTDGTTQPYAISFPDWWSGGGDTVADLPYINNQSGKQQQTVHLYMASVDLQAGKTVQYVTLPDVSQGATSGNVAMHVFAIASDG
ncbi:glycoside hydrolase family 3 C-terminal domain-containing protein [Actinoallomurus rhizosphaericola]|uniref:glycoside hydrolase family 3 C-terminal domain-containing protein n=1 Tax=Actinoallomurus rhizosphaericola TaxID=2952536 RepID=UPI002091F5AB|nr:glycoside hydrolase family 3 C-terminal domain-containing protein [Actinoallomurus rhizosphaericola]MCO5995360.1 glycoside hydrolase family 3 C-terminal domain-containing protein [Actinoallomurus rhizosphaericola]